MMCVTATNDQRRRYANKQPMIRGHL